MKYFEIIQRWFLAQSLSRKLSLIGGALFIIIFTTSLIYWVSAPNYAVLFNHVDAQDANQILTQLERANIDYKVKNQGRDILINKDLIDKTRIKLMGSDVHFTHTVGFELFDKNDWSMTDFSQKINYQRALQGELERTIDSLDEVKQARVQLSIPESKIFQDTHDVPRAAITLHLTKSLTHQQVKSIQQLIAASVPRLELKNVVIVDQNGNGLVVADDDGVSNHFSEKQKIEHYLNEKVMQMLNQVFAETGVMVKIDATINYDELQRERIKPALDGMLTHEKETRHSTANKNDKIAANSDFMREKSYEFGREKEHFTRANGTIERLTISVILPEKTPLTKIMQVERLVKSVVGFDVKRGDTISVEALLHITNHQTEASTHKPTPKPSRTYWSIGILLIIGVLAYAWRTRQRIANKTRLMTELKSWLLEHD